MVAGGVVPTTTFMELQLINYGHHSFIVNYEAIWLDIEHNSFIVKLRTHSVNVEHTCSSMYVLSVFN